MPKGQNTASLCHQPGITSTVQWALPTEPFPNDTKPWAQGQGPHTLHEENYRVSRPERPYGPFPVRSSWPRFQNGSWRPRRP